MPFDLLADRLCSLRDASRLRSLNPRAQDGVYLVAADGRRWVNFGSNDYLGFAARGGDDRRPFAGDGSGASSLVSGWTLEHQRLAEQIASFEGTEGAVVFPTGYAACLGTVATLAGPPDLILSDALNHASLIDGCRLSRAERVIYPHRDVEAVAEILAARRAEFEQVWLVTDGVFGMDGHVAPLQGLAAVADRYDTHLVVDEAHGTGVLGAEGQGSSEALGVKRRVAVTIGTLSKAVGVQGGFVAAPQVVIDYLVNRCRTLIYSTALAPPLVAAAREGIARIASDPGPRERVQELSRRFRRRLRIEATPIEQEIPIIPVMIGADQRTVDASARLAEWGFYVPAIRPPTVPEGTGRLRVSLSAAHDEAMVDALADALNRL